MAESKNAIRLAKLLLVEGKDEENFFTAAFKHLSINDVQVLAIAGKEKLPVNLKTLKQDPRFETVVSLAVVRDADQVFAGDPNPPAAERARESVSGALVGAQLFQGKLSHGQFAGERPRLGVFVIPDGIQDGMLETLCVQSVASEQGFSCVDQFFGCLSGSGVLPGNTHKARAHAWLSSRPEPDLRVGEAALKGYWPFDSEVFAPLWQFLRSI